MMQLVSTSAPARAAGASGAGRGLIRARRRAGSSGSGFRRPCASAWPDGACGSVEMQIVHIAAADPMARQVAAFFEIGDDALGGALGDTHLVGDLACGMSRVFGDAETEPARGW